MEFVAESGQRGARGQMNDSDREVESTVMTIEGK